jgi:hypothetical protein
MPGCRLPLIKLHLLVRRKKIRSMGGNATHASSQHDTRVAQQPRKPNNGAIDGPTLLLSWFG